MSAKIDSEKLMNELVPVAEKMLREYKEFYPYGGYLKPNGEIVHVGAEEQKTDFPKSKDLLCLLRESFSTMVKTGQCIATGIVLDVRVDLPGGNGRSDAIQVSLEHAEGYSAEVFLPYKISSGQVVYGTTFAQEGGHEFFGRA